MKRIFVTRILGIVAVAAATGVVTSDSILHSTASLSSSEIRYRLESSNSANSEYEYTFDESTDLVFEDPALVDPLLNPVDEPKPADRDLENVKELVIEANDIAELATMDVVAVDRVIESHKVETVADPQNTRRLVYSDDLYLNSKPITRQLAPARAVLDELHESEISDSWQASNAQVTIETTPPTRTQEVRSPQPVTQTRPLFAMAPISTNDGSSPSGEVRRPQLPPRALAPDQAPVQVPRRAKVREAAPAPSAQATPKMNSGGLRTVWSASTMANLRRVTMREVMQRRKVSDTGTFARRNGRFMWIPPVYRSGNVSKGKCRQAVSEILADPALRITSSLIVTPGSLAAATTGVFFRNQYTPRGQQKFKNIAAEIGFNASKAPIGSILVYAGGKYGHTEIRLDRNSFCSDYCKSVPISRYENRKLIGVYVPTEAGKK